MKMEHKFLIAILGIVASCAYAEVVFDPNYSAQGFIKFQVVQRDKSVSYEQSWFFNLMEDDIGRWRLDVHTEFPDPKLPISTTEVIAYDKTNIYSVIYSAHRVETPLGGTSRLIPGNNRYPARVCAGPYPVDHTSAVGLVWLAFLGGEYLPPTEKQVKFPNMTVPTARTDPVAWSCDFEFDLVHGRSRPLIKSGHYRLNPAYLLKSSVDYPELDEPQGDNKIEELQKQLKEYRGLKGDQLSRSKYQLDETTNVNGILIPKKFHCDWEPIAGDHAVTRMEGIVTNVTVLASTNLMPALIGTIDVQDRRFRAKNKVNWRRDIAYSLDKRGWITDTNDPKLLAALSKFPMTQIQLSSSRPAMYNAVIIMFLILVSAPIWWVFRKRSRSSRTPPVN